MAVSLPVVVLAGLTYGLLADAPQPTFDEALARAEAVPAPGFELAVLHEGALGPRLSRAVGPALADRRLDLRELRGRPVVVNFWPPGVTRAAKRHRCSSAPGKRHRTGGCCSSV